MKSVNIKEVYITNFGRISSFNIKMEKGLTSIEHENGWGKSTFAAFIKAMFYGLMEASRSSKVFGDRERYRPWQGGVFGGSLVFEITEGNRKRNYRIERTFGEKKKGDTFNLFDNDTNTNSNDYGECLGETLFGVNMDTFERSVFITLDVNKLPEKSDDIAARLSGIVQNDDMASFSKAIDEIDDALSAIKSVRGKGIIPSLEKQIADDESALRSIAGDEKQLEITANNIKIAAAKKDELMEKQKSVQDAYAMLGYYAKKQQRASLEAERDAAKMRREKLLHFFNGTPPSDSMIQKIDSALDEYNKQKTIAENNALRPSEKAEYDALLSSFGGSVPKADEAARLHCLSAQHDETLRRIAERKLNGAETAEYDALLPKYCNVSIEEIDKYVSKAEAAQKSGEEILTLAEKLAEAESALSGKKALKPKNTARKVFASAAAGMALTGAGLFVFLGMFHIAGMALIAAAGVLAILAIIKKQILIDTSAEEKSVSQAKSAVDETKLNKNKLETACDAFIARFMPNNANRISALAAIKAEYIRYDSLKDKKESFDKWLSSLPAKSEDEEKEILSFVSRYGCNDISKATMFLGNVKESLKEVQVYRNRMDSSAAASKKQNEAGDMLNSLLSGYACNKSSPLEKQVQECRGNKNALQIADDSAISASNALDEFDNAHKDEMQKILNAQKSGISQAQLDEQSKAIGQEINKEEKEIMRLKAETDSLTSNIDMKGEKEDSIAAGKAALVQNNARYAVLCKTKEFLIRAQEALQHKYMDPMAEGFNKYAKMMGSSLPLNITSELNVTVTSNGATHPYKHLSDGYKDLVNVCARLSLADALFDGVIPPIIMDDPFVNLDDSKVNSAASMVRALSKERQVIYLVCHNSRAV